jgi:hypothetical protein
MHHNWSSVLACCKLHILHESVALVVCSTWLFLGILEMADAFVGEVCIIYTAIHTVRIL